MDLLMKLHLKINVGFCKKFQYLGLVMQENGRILESLKSDTEGVAR